MRRYIGSLVIILSVLISLLTIGCSDKDKVIISKRSFRFTYSIKIPVIPSNSEKVLIYFPVPRANEHQDITDISIDSPFAYELLTDDVYKNKIAMIEAKGVSGAEIEAKLSFRVDRRAVSVLDGSQKNIDVPSPAMRKRLLEPDRLVPLGGPVLEACREALGNGRSDMENARAIYDYVVSTMVYDKSGTGWGRGDVLYACDARSGNCTDFHSLFIAMARASGIPARFLIGFPISGNEDEGEIGGYHCWAEFYIDDYGWVPVDASEASKYPEKREFFFGNLDYNRVMFTTGRDLVFDKDNVKEPQNFLIYPLVIIDGETFSDYETSFEYSRAM